MAIGACAILYKIILKTKMNEIMETPNGNKDYQSTGASTDSHESPRRASMTTTAQYPSEVQQTPQSMHWDKQSQQQATSSTLPSLLALALTPKTHNKRRRSLLPALPSVLGTNKIGSSSTTTITESDSNTIISSTSSSVFDCQSLQRCLKRVRLSSGSPKSSSYYSRSSGPSKTERLSSSPSKSPGEIRLQKDIQHSIIHHSWKYTSLGQQFNLSACMIGSEKSLSMPDKHSSQQHTNSNNEQWVLPLLAYDPIQDALTVQPTNHGGLFKDCSDVEITNQNISCCSVDVTIRRNSKTPMYFTVETIINNATTNDELGIQKALFPRFDSTSTTGVSSMEDENYSTNTGNPPHAIKIVFKLHFPRLYPHQPPIVHQMEHYSLCNPEHGTLCLQSSSSEESLLHPLSLPTTTTTNTKTTQVNVVPLLIPSPTILIESNPTESSSTDENNLAFESNSYKSSTIVIKDWTPLSRLNDIVDMLLQSLCRYYYPILVNNYSLVSEISHSSRQQSLRDNCSQRKGQATSSYLSFDEKKDDDDRVLLSFPVPPLNGDSSVEGKEVQVDDNINKMTVVVAAAFQTSPSDDNNGNSLTPTMSNTTSKRHQQSVLSSYNWSKHVSIDLDNKYNNNFDASSLPSSSDRETCFHPGLPSNDVDPRYRSPLRSHPNGANRDSDDDSDIDYRENSMDEIEIDLDDGEEEADDDYYQNVGTFSSSMGSMIVQYECNRSFSMGSNSSCSSFSQKDLDGPNRIVDVVLPAQEAFPPGRFNVGYLNTSNYTTNNKKTVSSSSGSSSTNLFQRINRHSVFKAESNHRERYEALDDLDDSSLMEIL